MKTQLILAVLALAAGVSAAQTNLLYDGSLDTQTSIVIGVVPNNYWSSQAGRQWTTTNGIPAASISDGALAFSNSGNQQIYQMVENVDIPSGTILTFSVRVTGTSTAASSWYLMPRTDAAITAAHQNPDTTGVGMTGASIPAENIIGGTLSGTTIALPAGTYENHEVRATFTVPWSSDLSQIEADVMTNLALRIVAGAGNLRMDDFVIDAGNMNIPPDAVHDSLTLTENSSAEIDVLVNDIDADGDTLVISAVTQGENGGTAIVGAKVSYTPATDWFGQDNFTYTVIDGQGGADSATVSVTVEPDGAYPPGGTDDRYVTEQNLTLVVDVPQGVLANDSDDQGSTLTISRVTDNVDHGSLVMHEDGSFFYTPAASYFGTDQFTYELANNSGGTDTAVVIITIWQAPSEGEIVAAMDAYVDAANAEDNYGSAPHLQVRYAQDEVQSQAYLYFVMSGVVWPVQSGTLRLYQSNSVEGAAEVDVYLADDAWLEDGITWNNQPGEIGEAIGTFEVLNEPGWIDVPLNAEALEMLRWGPNYGLVLVPRASEAIEAIHFSSTGVSAQAPMLVVSTDWAPVARDDNFVVEEKTVLQVAAPGVLGNDFDLNGGNLHLNTTPLEGAAHGTLVLNANGSFTYTPEAGYLGPDGFTYEISDGQGGSDTAVVEITVQPEDPNLLYDGAFDGQIAIVLGVVPGNNWSARAGRLWTTTTTTPEVAIVGHRLVFNNHTNQQIYQLVENVDLPAGTVLEFSVRVSGTCIDTANWYLMPRTDAAIAAAYASPYTVGVSMVTGSMRAYYPIGAEVSSVNLTLPPGTYQDRLVSARYTVPFTASNSSIESDVLTNLAFRMVTGAGDLVMDDFSITVVEMTGLPPQADDDDATTNENEAVVIDVLANDTDGDGDALTVIYAADPPHGTASVNEDGTVTYTPDPLYFGSDSFSYLVSDGHGNLASAQVDVTVVPGPRPPSARDDSYSVLPNGSLAIAAPGLLSNDTDVNGDALVVNTTPLASVVHGYLALNADGSFTYTPAIDFGGSDSFTYEVSDESGGVDQAVVTIAVGSPQRINIVKTSYLAADGPPENSNYGHSSQMRIDHLSDSRQTRGILEIDLSSIPAGATITSARLMMLNTEFVPETHVIQAFRVTRPWVEAGVSWNNADNSVPVPWTTPGGDYDATARASINLGSIWYNTWITMDLTDLVREWHEGTYDNCGIVLIDTGPNTTSRVYLATEDYSMVEYRPYMEIEYTLAAQVRQVKPFYNNSAWDGNNATANAADDLAVAVDKLPLLPGQAPTFANVVTCNRGINGLMIDITNLPATPTDEDIVVEYSTQAGGDQLSHYALGGDPAQIALRPGSGIDLSDRLTLVFPDSTANNGRWMRVTLLATPNTGLSEDYIFYYGLAIADTGNSTSNFQVTAGDQGGIRANPRTSVNPAPIDFKYDINRDAAVTAADQALARTYLTTSLNNLLKYATAAP